MNILLIDDHKETRKEMSALINAEEDMAVVAEAATGEAGVQKADELKPGLIVMDILLPGINGIEATKIIVAKNPKARILALSNHAGHFLVQAVLKAGANGYIRKDHAFEELVPALRSISVGKQYLGQGVND